MSFEMAFEGVRLKKEGKTVAREGRRWNKRGACQVGIAARGKRAKKRKGRRLGEEARGG